MAFKEHWVRNLEQYRDQYEELLENDPFDAWERNQMPEGAAERLLHHGLAIAYGSSSDPMASEFFRRCAAVTERALIERKLEAEPCRGAFPKNRGRLTRAGCYAGALLGATLDLDALRRSSVDYERWCRDYGASEWDSQAEANFLAAVRLALLAGDYERARDLLSGARPFSAHLQECQVLLGLARVNGGALEEGLRDRLVDYFDRIRDPKYRPNGYMEREILRLEVGVLVVGDEMRAQSGLDWRMVVERVAF